MKFFFTVLMSSVLVLASLSAQAETKFTANGFLDMFVERNSGGANIDRSKKEDSFLAGQFSVLEFRFDSGTVNGMLSFALGQGFWGFNDQVFKGLSLGADGINLATSQAWIGFKIPGTEISTRLGAQNLALPNSLPGILNPVLGYSPSTVMAAISFNYNINEYFGITGFWGRPVDRDSTSSGENRKRDEMDLFNISLPIKYANYLMLILGLWQV